MCGPLQELSKLRHSREAQLRNSAVQFLSKGQISQLRIAIITEVVTLLRLDQITTTPLQGEATHLVDTRLPELHPQEVQPHLEALLLQEVILLQEVPHLPEAHRLRPQEVHRQAEVAALLQEVEDVDKL
jgi:hypothetical protein